MKINTAVFLTDINIIQRNRLVTHRFNNNGINPLSKPGKNKMP